MIRDFNLRNADVKLYPRVDLEYDSEELFSYLLEYIPWEQRKLFVYGKEWDEPRQVAWFGDHSYTYSGSRFEPKPFNMVLSKLNQRISDLTGTSFNGVLLNLYKDGRSSIGMHADDEPEFGTNPTIASLSLGDAREFTFQRKDKSEPPTKILLENGSLLVMAGETQTYWKHGIAKTTKPVGPRINLTFRKIVQSRD